MPILPGSPSATITIGDLVDEVIRRTENRLSDTSRAAIWLRDALLEITSNPEWRNEFDDLEVVGETFVLTASTQEYDFGNLLTPGDYNIATLSVFMWTDPPTNRIRRQLRFANYQEADKYPTQPGIPIAWYRFGDNFGTFPVPDRAYSVQARYYREHPISEDDLTATTVFLPRDWREILVWAAVERGYMEILEYEKAQAIHVMIHGDPSDPRRPGLIYNRKKRHEKEAWRQHAALRPQLRPYGYRG